MDFKSRFFLKKINDRNDYFSLKFFYNKARRLYLDTEWQKIDPGGLEFRLPQSLE